MMCTTIIQPNRTQGNSPAGYRQVLWVVALDEKKKGVVILVYITNLAKLKQLIISVTDK